MWKTSIWCDFAASASFARSAPIRRRCALWTRVRWSGEFRVQAAKIRRTVAQTAVAANVNWTFRTTRGAVTSELLAAAESAGMLTMGRVGHSMGKRFGSTAQNVMRNSMRPVVVLSDEELAFPPIVLYDATPAADRALQLAVTLLRHQEEPLFVLVAPLADESRADREQRAQAIAGRVKGYGLDVRTIVFDQGEEGDAEPTGEESAVTADPTAAEIADVINKLARGTLILPAAWAELLNEVRRSAIVVP